ncbi:hypothetical protein E4K72_18450 [Oxalobacteraceae bacterium OM1]|nr:hypothetical protein E4K72_18450 [Oxalobacteraceae bacterium OM1]
MLKFHWLAAALAAVPLAVLAQSAAQQPADPQAPTASLQYESAFAGYRPAPESEVSPDKQWRAANDEVGGLSTQAGQTGQASAVERAASMQGHDHAGHHHQ